MSELALSAAVLPAGTPPWKQELLDLVVSYLTVQFTENVKVPNYGADTPPPDRQDRPWNRTDINGRPIGTWIFYNGTWVKDWGVPVGMIAVCNDLVPLALDPTGKATSSAWMGWFLCNGQNGTPDMRDRVVLGYKDNATATMGSTGGTKEIQVANTTQGLYVDLRKAQTFRGNTPGNIFPDFVFYFTEDARERKMGGVRNPQVPVEGGTTSPPINVMNPYIVQAFIQYRGYS
jgi:hypothetical protein